MDVVASRFACGSCGKQHRWKPEIAGKKAQCTCGHRLVVPAEPISQPAQAVRSIAVEKKIAPAPPAEEPAGDDIYDMIDQAPIRPAPRQAIAPAVIAAPTQHRIPAAGLPRTLAYATPKDDAPPLLGDADIDWVMQLRNAARLMCMALSLNFIAYFFLPRGATIGAAKEIVIAGMNLAAAWLITAPEPARATKWLSVQMFLRITACIAGVGEILAALGIITESPFMLMLGGALYLMTVPSTFLFLWYLRTLALRLPSVALAVNCAIVMIGLPAVLALTMTGAYFAATTRSAGMMIVTGLGAVLGLLILRIWYIVLLIWFNRSFS